MDTVHCYVKARQALLSARGNIITNRLTDAFDHWIGIETECESSPHGRCSKSHSTRTSVS